MHRPAVGVAPAAQVRSLIARAVLGIPNVDPVLGSITLLPHQVSAVHRLRAAIDEFNGALLCDEVGMGKTYVALAIARSFVRRLVVAPAALTSMWRHALSNAQVDAELTTLEALSRSDIRQSRGGVSRPARARYEIVVIDEAHHARNPRTNRYFALESLVRGARVVLLSATPIHNNRDDLVALLSLFLGSRARSMTSAELAACIVRREQRSLGDALGIPAVRPPVFHEVPDDAPLVRQLLGLPPPVPFKGGGSGRTLVGRGLIHQWASSEAALREAVVRRIARATALCSSLEAGTYPTARELETWIYGEGTLQLGFAELLAAPFADHRELLVSVRAHLSALEDIRAGFSPASAIDAERAEIVRRIRASGSGKLVAFAQYAETVSMQFRQLSSLGRVAMLTSHGARVAGGTLSRQEALARFAPAASGAKDPAAAEVVDLLLTTDLLSEGVNLQDACTVVHLDVPWTIARMEQRVGRAARLGSRHREVSVHVIRPPRSAMLVLGGESIVARKWRVANTAVGATSMPGYAERLRSIMQSWLALDSDGGADQQSKPGHQTPVATVAASIPGFVCAVSANGVALLLAGSADGISLELADQTELCLAASGRELPTDSLAAAGIVDAVHEWWVGYQGSVAAGVDTSGALRRNRITHRIDALIESAPPHLRASRLRAAARARRIATTQQCAAVERELGDLVDSKLAPDDWLSAVGNLETAGTDPCRDGRASASLEIHAILLLETTPRRSRSPLAPESP